MTEERPVSVRGAGTSVVTYRFGGREYPLKTVTRCATCMSPYRFEIEEAIVSGRVYKRIEEMVAGYGEEFRISSRGIADHYYNGHMPLDLTNTRSIIEDRAEKVGKRIEDESTSLVDGITLMETVVAKTFEAIVKGEVSPGVREGLAAAKMLADIGEYDTASADQQAYVEAFMVYQEEAEKIMGAEAFRAFGAALAANPVLNALLARYEGEEAAPEAIEGGDSQE